MREPMDQQKMVGSDRRCHRRIKFGGLGNLGSAGSLKGTSEMVEAWPRSLVSVFSDRRAECSIR